VALCRQYVAHAHGRVLLSVCHHEASLDKGGGYLAQGKPRALGAQFFGGLHKRGIAFHVGFAAFTLVAGSSLGFAGDPELGDKARLFELRECAGYLPHGDLRGDGKRVFEVGMSARTFVLFLRIRFEIRRTEIQGHVALLMDIPSIEELRSLVADFVINVTRTRDEKKLAPTA
jgi:hypothetical protein